MVRLQASTCPDSLHLLLSVLCFDFRRDLLTFIVAWLCIQNLGMGERSAATHSSAAFQRWQITRTHTHTHFTTHWALVLALRSLHLSFPYPCSPLCPQTPEELDDSDFETEDFDVRSRTSVQTEDDQLIAGQSARVSSFGKSFATLQISTGGNPCHY